MLVDTVANYVVSSTGTFIKRLSTSIQAIVSPMGLAAFKMWKKSLVDVML